MSDTCEKCLGNKKIAHLDIQRAKTTYSICPLCKGSGKKPAPRPTNGDVCVRLKCEVLLFQHLVDSSPVSTLELRVWPVIKQEQWVTGPYGKLVWAEIPRMHTKSKYRGQGIMSRLIKFAMSDPKIDHITTSFDDSTEQGRSFLGKNGFHREGVSLVWRRNKEPGSDSNLAPV